MFHAKKAIASLILPLAAVFANDQGTIEKTTETKTTEITINKHMGYFDIGLGPMPLPAPSFGLGYRYQHNHHGMDLNIRGTSAIGIYDMTIAQTNLLYNYYFKPSLQSQTYMGIGAGAAYVFGKGPHFHDYKDRFVLSPEIVIGKNFVNHSGDERFIQAQINIPNFTLREPKKPIYAPAVFLTYGLCF